MPEGFKQYLCWDEKEVLANISTDIGSIPEGEEYRFLAVHSPMVITDVEGNLGKQNKEYSESAILKKFKKQIEDAVTENRITAIVGDPGGGKSHLVRWVYAQRNSWETSDCEVLYVPRRNTDARQFLDTILNRLGDLGGEVESIRENLKSALTGDNSEQEMRERLQSELVLNLRRDRYQLPALPSEQEDDDLKRKILGEMIDGSRGGGLADLIRDYEFWNEEGSVMAKAVHSLRGREETAEQPDPEFSYFAIEDLRVSAKQGKKIKSGGSIEQQYLSMLKQPKVAAIAIKYLNAAIRPAMARTLGVTGTGEIKEIFFSVRRKLKEEKKKLVLIFEDLSTHDVAMDPIYAQFEQQPEGEFCPIVSLYAITKEPFIHVPESVRTRNHISFNIEIPDEPSKDAEQLVSRYLNSARLGSEALSEAYSNASDADLQTGEWVPNACDGCLHQSVCHGTFSSNEDSGFGLYPLNRRATQVLLKSKPGAVRNPQSNREIIRRIRDLLSQTPTLMRDNRFPNANNLSRVFTPSATKAIDDVLNDPKLNENEPPGQQVYFTRLVWCGEENDHPEAIGEAFNLSVIGGGTLNQEPEPQPQPQPKPQTLEDQTLEAIVKWRNSDPNDANTKMKLGDADKIRRVMYQDVLDRINWEMLLIEEPKQGTDSSFFLGTFFDQSSFKIQHASGNDPIQGHLVFPNKGFAPDRKSYELMTFAMWFKLEGHLNPEKSKYSIPLTEDKQGFHKQQIQYEHFIQSCADQVKDELKARIGDGVASPVGASIALSALSRRILGNIDQEEMGDQLKTTMSTNHEPLGLEIPQNQIGELQRVANKIVKKSDLRNKYFRAFATARRGTGAPTVGDITGLAEIVEESWERPFKMLEELEKNNFQAFPELALEVKELNEVYTAVSWAEERQTMSHKLDTVLEYIETEEAIDNLKGLLISTIQAVNLADAVRIKPDGSFHHFLENVDNIGPLLAKDELVKLIATRDVLSTSDDTKLLDIAYEITKWDSYIQSLEGITNVLHETSDHLDSIRGGTSDDELLSPIAEIIENLEALSDIKGLGD